VLALRESEASKWERATVALRAGGITINDFRRATGLPPVDGGDVFLTPAGVIPTPLGESIPVPAPTPPVPPEVEAASYAEAVLAKARALGPDRHHGIHVLEEAAQARASQNGGVPHA
jgi:hypothetical protein